MILETILSSPRDIQSAFLNTSQREMLADCAETLSEELSSIRCDTEIGEFSLDCFGVDALSNAREVCAATTSSFGSSVLNLARDSFLHRKADPRDGAKTLRRPRTLYTMIDSEADEAFEELERMQADAALRAWIESPLPGNIQLAAAAWVGIAQFTKEYERLRALPVPVMPVLEKEIEDRFASEMRDILSSQNPGIVMDRLLKLTGLSLFANALVGGPAAALSLIASRSSSHGRTRFFEEVTLRATNSPDETKLARSKVLSIYLKDKQYFFRIPKD